MEPTLASVALNALLLHCTVLGADTAWICHARPLLYSWHYMPIRRLKQLQTPELKNISELYRKAASVHTAPYIPIPLECHIYIPLIIEQWI